MNEPVKYIMMRNIDAFWIEDNDIIFEGITYSDNELTSVSIPLNEITDSLDFIIKKRIQYITDKKKTLNAEQKQLKEKIKLWKSLNI
tara:strand:- start:378 stop:638 length:261 start_codon:yes stop_codon:yes gene_type:complete